ncbi:MAG: 2-amino-4-hydroxy-6-hydroxymethyldihydropteridine diphosphokinase [Proteobacteria bacterium]|nr:2-amino-4-hydroxy-6-hydroxymethyldihydropteridine diphosphokinase [Pseudomonadota bacterium]
MIRQVAIGFGGNVGGDAAITARFVQAREAFAVIGSVRSAALYRSAPIGPAQDAYLNTAIALRAELAPAELIALTLELEALLGRDRTNEPRWGPRPIDLDVLVVVDPAGYVRDDPGPPALELPHPRIGERRFVLEPLRDLYGDDLVIRGQSIATLLRGVAGQIVTALTDRW